MKSRLKISFKMKIITILTASLLLMSCASKKNADSKSKKSDIEMSGFDIIQVKATVGQFAKASDPINEIDTVFIEGNTMYIDVVFGGGCKDHEFQLIGSLAIAKSYPPIRGIQLVHKANEDNCRALVRKRLEVNIEEIAYQQEEGSEIYLSLEGWKDRIKYTYKSK